MKNNMNISKVAIVLAGTLAAVANLYGQDRALSPEQSPEYQMRLQQLVQITTDKSGYVNDLISRLETSATAPGRFDATTEAKIRERLMNLAPSKLLAIGQSANSASTLLALVTGPVDVKTALASISGDLVYTPVTPCRILDTRNVSSGTFQGPIAAGTYLIDADNADGYAGGSGANQGGSATACIPYDTAWAIAMEITVISPSGLGYLTAWGYDGSVPTAATMIYSSGEIETGFTIDPIGPGIGGDFHVTTSQPMQLAIDIVGYFAENTATALNCTTGSSAMTAVPVNYWTAVDASCPAGFTATGGGFFTTEGSTGWPGVWTMSMPGLQYGFNGWRIWVDNQTSGNRNVQTWVSCCQLPGR